MKIVKLILILAVAFGLGLPLSVANQQPVTVDILLTTFTWPLAAVLAAELALVAFGLLVVHWTRVAWLKHRIRKLEKALHAHKADLTMHQSTSLSEL